MYNGYLIKIDGKILPLEYMVGDSWKCNPDSRRILADIYDGEGCRHLCMSRHLRSVIEFNLVEHTNLSHPDIMAFFNKRQNVEVEFYNDNTGEYRAGIFTIDECNPHHKYRNEKEIWYAECAVKMEEN